MKTEEYSNRVIKEANNLPWSFDDDWDGKDNDMCRKHMFEFYKKRLDKGNMV